MRKDFFILIIVAIVSLSLVQCRKNPSQPNINLYDKDTTAIKNQLLGSWKLHYYYGGLCSSCKFNVDSSDIIYQFSQNQIKITTQGTTTIDTTYRFTAYSGSYVHKIISFYAGIVPENLEAVQIQNDTLILAQPFFGSPDYQEFYFTKSK